MSKQSPPAPAVSAIGPCPTIIQTVGRPGTGSLPSTNRQKHFEKEKHSGRKPLNCIPLTDGEFLAQKEGDQRCDVLGKLPVHGH